MSRVTCSKTLVQGSATGSAVDYAAQEGAEQGRPLSRNAAALLEVLTLPALEQCLQGCGGGVTAAAARDIAALGTVLGRPGDPGVQHFLERCWEALEQPAAAAAPSWMAALPRTLKDYDPDLLESRKLPELKALSRALDLPLSGKKADYVERLQDLLPLLPQRVPLLVMATAQPKLAKIVLVQEELGLLAAEDAGEDKKLSAYKAKRVYLLSSSDLRGVRNVSTYRYRPLYLVKDVKRAALLKYGSLAGVEDAVEQSCEKAMAKRQKTADQRAARQLEAETALAARGLSRLKASVNIKRYITYGRTYMFGDLDTAITHTLDAELRDQAQKARLAEQAVRREQLLASLTELGLEAHIGNSACQSFIWHGVGLQGAVDTCVASEQRRLELLARLTELGLEGSMDFSVAQNYVSHGSNGLQGVVDACVAGEQRRQELSHALAARGLELDTTPHNACIAYIDRGMGQVAQIVATLDETKFLNTHTSYQVDFQETHEATIEYLGHFELSRRARERALSKWAAQAHATLEACLADPRLPPSLLQAVRDCWIQPAEQQQQQQQD